jgi:replication-associated recombination protein RarA
MNTTSPMHYRPTQPEHLIGPARKIANVLVPKARRLLENPNESLMKVLLYGVPGVGKSRVAEMIGMTLTGGQRLSYQEIEGKNVKIDTVRSWMDQLCYGSLFGGFQVQVVNELDLVPRDAQDLMLGYLDRLPTGRAFIGTSNLQLDLLAERFQTRLQQFKMDAPDTSEIVAMLQDKFCIPETQANQIAVGSGGNVRAALADAESLLDCQVA